LEPVFCVVFKKARLTRDYSQCFGMPSLQRSVRLIAIVAETYCIYNSR